MSPQSLIQSLIERLRPNRRRYDRRRVAFPIQLRVAGDLLPCHMTNVSPSGALLTGTEMLPVGTLAVVEISPLDLKADARVVRHTPHGIGIEFSRDGVGAIIAGWASGQTPRDP